MKSRNMQQTENRQKLVHHISAQVDAEDGDSAQRKRNAGKDEEQEGGNFWDVTGQGVCNGLLQVVKNETTCRNMQDCNG